MSGESLETKQQQRTFLRERFLRLLGGCTGLEASVRMHQKTTVDCRLGAADLDFQRLQVSDLRTPMGVLPNAMLRSKDVISITIPSVDTQKQ